MYNLVFSAGKSAKEVLAETNLQDGTSGFLESRELRSFKAMLSDPTHKEKFVKVLKALIGKQN